MIIKFLNGTTQKIANLQDADLEGANLRGAYLQGADLQGADLQGADLEGAALQGADLEGADLRGAYLQGADLQGADLRGAALQGADLRGAYFRGAYLRGANLEGANLQGAIGMAAFVIVPAGALIGWKKVSNGIAKLRIPAKAARVNAYGARKCRAAYAVVLSAPKGAVDIHKGKTKYIKGRIVRPDKFDPDLRVECSNGIHFFITRQEAEDYA